MTVEDGVDGSGPIFDGPAGSVLEDVRVRLFEHRSLGGSVADDSRTQVVYERLAEWLAERAEECASTGASASSMAAAQSAASAAPTTWGEYLRQTEASIQKRAHLVDRLGKPRVLRTYTSSGSLLHVDLMDWRGRLRARLAHEGASGEVSAVTLVSSEGLEFRYTAEHFSRPVASVRLRLEQARRSCNALVVGNSPKRRHAAQRSVEALCAVALPQLERLMKREVEEGRQLVPPFEDLMEMDMAQIIDLLECG